jgi:arylsulfatase A-like enzyme
MRCSGIPPAGVKCFSEYLRAAGYYCTNNSKTDYQFDPPASAWDENSKNAHWKNRPEGAPFFAVFNFTTTHEGQVRSRDSERLAQIEALGDLRHDPAGVTLPPYHADTPSTRKDWAQYHDLITLMDREVGAALAELEAAGLAEDTIVWFWGDHGRGLTRCKRWLYESGTRVPLLVHVPEKYRAWVCPAAPETLATGTNDNLVSFIDFAPTVLSLAGVAPPEHLQGQAFLGRDLPAPREYVYGARDRMDEAYDCIRTVRDKRFRYFRNYMPWLPYAQSIEYMDEMPMAKDLRALHAEGKLDAAQARWFADRKPEEELYDVEVDPHELTNLAEDPAYAEDLLRLRAAHEHWAESTGDLGLIPEPELDALKWPNGKVPICATPTIIREGGTLRLECRTPGASILYREDTNRNWRLYTGPFVPSGVYVDVEACRIGFENSLPTALANAIPRDEYTEYRDWTTSPEARDVLRTLRALRALDSPGASGDSYIETLTASDASLRHASIVALHRIVPSDAPLAPRADAIRPLREDVSPTVRIAAARALCNWGETEASLPVLTSALSDPSQSVRLHAMIALREIGEAARPVLPAIEKSIGDSWSYVVREAARAVVGLGGIPKIGGARN